MQFARDHKLQSEFRHVLSDEVAVSYHTLKRVDDLPELSHSPILVEFSNSKVFELLMEHGYVDPSMHPGSLTAGLISILGRRIDEEARRERNAQRTNDGQHWRVISHWLGLSNLKNQQSQAKCAVIRTLISDLRNLQAAERSLRLGDEIGWAECRVWCRRLLHQAIQDCQEISWNNGFMRGKTHQILVEADLWLAKFATPHKLADGESTHLSADDQGVLRKTYHGYHWTYSGPNGQDMLRLLAEHYLDTDSGADTGLRRPDDAQKQSPKRLSLVDPQVVTDYQKPYWWRRNRVVFQLLRLRQHPLWALLGAGIAAGIMIPVWMFYESVMVNFLVVHAGFVGYAATLGVFVSLFALSVLTAYAVVSWLRSITLRIKNGDYDDDLRSSDSEIVDLFDDVSLRGPVTLVPRTTHGYNHDNPFRHTPLSRVWTWIKTFFYFFDSVGYHDPVTMTAYGVTYGMVVTDLLGTSVLPKPVHDVAHTAMLGLVNPADGRMLGAISTAFLSGKAVLVVGNTLVERGHGWIAQAVEQIGRRPFDAIALAGGMGVLVAVEDGWKMLTRHEGRWEVFDSATASWKPVLVIADTWLNPKESLVGSMAITGWNTLKMFTSWHRFKQGLRNIERAVIDGLLAIVRLPFRSFLYPFSRTLLHALLAVGTHVLRSLMYFTPGLSQHYRYALVKAASILSRQILRLPLLSLRLDGRIRAIAQRTRLLHLVVIGLSIFATYRLGGHLFGAAATLPITMGVLFVIVQLCCFGMVASQYPTVKHAFAQYPQVPIHRRIMSKIMLPSLMLVAAIAQLPNLAGLSQLSAFFILTALLSVFTALWHATLSRTDVQHLAPCVPQRSESCGSRSSAKHPSDRFEQRLAKSDSRSCQGEAAELTSSVGKISL